MHVHYRPAPHVLDRLAKVRFVAVVGPTSVGKTTMIKAAVAKDPDLHLVLNHTSRKPRPGEQEGTDYSFKTREEMEARIAEGGYVQVAPSVFGDLYATAPERYATEGVSVLAVLADAIPVFRSLPFRSFRVVFSVPPSWEVWQTRLQSHSFTPAQMERRLDEAEVSLRFALQDENIQFVINDMADQAAEDFAAIALDKSLPERLQVDQSRAREIVRVLLDKLQATKNDPVTLLSL
jgi:guanylate kinase